MANDLKEIKSETKDHIISAVTSCGINEWNEFFEFLRTRQYQQIRSAIDGEQLQKLQANVKAFDLIENIFKDIISTKKIA